MARKREESGPAYQPVTKAEEFPPAPESAAMPPRTFRLLERASALLAYVRRAKLQTILVAALLIAGWASAWYFYAAYDGLRNDPQIAAEREAARTLSELSSLIEVPETELPSFATVVDPTLLSADPFFAKAQSGDILIVYPEARQAYLYRPSTKKIINVGAFVHDTQVPSAAFKPPAQDGSIQNNDASQEIEAPIE